MAKFYGVIGYSETSEIADGVWEDVITELTYSGDVIRNSKRFQAGESLNDDLTVNNEISIVADPFANQNFHKMKYVTWLGAKWKITKVDVQRPRLLLTIGGVYNG
jgi:hypothetical protein